MKPLAVAILIAVSSHALAEMNSAQLLQSGNDNIGAIDQQGSGNYAYLQQEAQDNSQATITQSGVSNSASVYQMQGFENTTHVTQFGDSNTLDISMTGSADGAIASSIGNNNSIRSEQYGGVSSAMLTQVGDNNAIDSSLQSSTSALVSQTGNNNTAYVTASSYRLGSNQTEVTQNGDDNQATTRITSQFGNIALTHDGIGNLANISSSGRSTRVSGVSTGQTNTVDISQDIETGSVRFEQAGDGNILAVNQEGYSGYYQADVTQVGIANQATLVQSAGEQLGTSSAALSQTGTGNIATVIQRYVLYEKSKQVK